MAEPVPPELPELPYLPEPVDLELVATYDWLRLSCHILSTLSLMLIAIALIVRL